MNHLPNSTCSTMSNPFDLTGQRAVITGVILPVDGGASIGF